MLVFKWYINGIIVVEDIVFIYCKIDICIFWWREVCFKSFVFVVVKKLRLFMKRMMIKDIKIEIKFIIGFCWVIEWRCCKWVIECEMVYFLGYKCMLVIFKMFKSFVRSILDYLWYRKCLIILNICILYYIFVFYIDYRLFI